MSSLREVIKQRIIRCENLQKLSDNPDGNRFNFISNAEVIREQAIQEYKTWYVGNSNELQNLYTNKNLSENAMEPIYNRNIPNYFWSIATNETPVKKVHSGIPRACIDTICNVLGMPEINVGAYNEVWERIARKNKFQFKLTQEARPLSCVEGDGCWKVNLFKNCDYPVIEFVEGKDCDFAIGQGGVVAGIIFSSYYKYNDKNYVLLETRRVGRYEHEDTGEVEEGSIIEYELYRLMKRNECVRVSLDEIPELRQIDDKPFILPNYNKILAVPTPYFFDINNKGRGRSILEGKLDLADDIDQCLSQASQTDRVSTPVEYYPVDVLDRDNNGNPVVPSVFNRQIIKKEVLPDGNGNSDGEIQTTQPQLNFQQYIDRYISLVNMFLIGILSPATMGFDVAKKDNAEAQREKEKVTLYTRNNIICCEQEQLSELVNIALAMEEYRTKNNVSLVDYDVSVKFDDYASPTFDNLSAVLLPLFNSGAISTEEFVKRLYGKNMSDEEKLREIERINEMKSQNDMQLGDFGLDSDGKLKDTINEDKQE